jgi:alpha-galactosidase
VGEAACRRSVAVGVVNLGAAETAVTVKTSDLGLNIKVKSARDLWKHSSVTFREGAYTVKIPSHGVPMLRVTSKT